MKDVLTRRRWLQIRAIIRLEMRKTFFSKRGLWVYLLALALPAIFVAHGVITSYQHERSRELASHNERPLTSRDFEAITDGMPRQEVERRLGKASVKYEQHREEQGEHDKTEAWEEQVSRYSDGSSEYSFGFKDDQLDWTHVRRGDDFAQDSMHFAATFQFFYLRLVIFFGCLGIFMNLFRGELLDKSLHFYLLAPIRREVLLAGKYLAGLLATVTIFTTSTALQLFVMGWFVDRNALNNYLTHDHGVTHVLAYLGITALACVGYGSVFLAAGLMFRNPIFPAAGILIWESINPFLPALLKKFSVIYYLKALCPLNLPSAEGAPPLFALLISNPDPIAAPVAVAGVLAVSILILFLASTNVRRLEINYTTE